MFLLRLFRRLSVNRVCFLKKVHLLFARICCQFLDAYCLDASLWPIKRSKSPSCLLSLPALLLSPISFWGHVHSNPDKLISVSVWRIRFEFSRPHEYATAICICLSRASRDVPSHGFIWFQSSNPSDPNSLWKAVSKICAFGARIHWFRVEGRPIRMKKDVVSKVSGFVFWWYLLTCYCPLNCRPLKRRLSFHLWRGG